MLSEEDSWGPGDGKTNEKGRDCAVNSLRMVAAGRLQEYCLQLGPRWRVFSRGTTP
jgi:hypothetical protein